MKTLTQDTQASQEIPLPFELRFGSPERRDNLTYGTYIEAAGLDVGFQTRSLEEALDRALELENGGAMASVVSNLVNVIVAALEGIYGVSHELPPLPAMHAYKLDDGSLILEWINDHFRIGFGIGPTVQESSWFLVTDESLDSYNGSGQLNADNLSATVFSLVRFVLANS